MDNPTLHPKWERQVQLEKDIVRLGVERYQRNAAKARKAGRGSIIPHVSRTMTGQIELFSAAISAYLIQPRVQGERLAVAHQYLGLLTPDENAFIAMKVVLNQVLMSKSFVAVAEKVGHGIQDECRMRYYRGENKKLFDAIMRSPKIQRSRTEYVRKIVRKTMTTADVNPAQPWLEWDKSHLILLGTKLIEIMIDSTHAVEREKSERRGRKNKLSVLCFTVDVLSWFEKVEERTEILWPAHLYTVMTPQDWTTPYDGGYWTPILHRSTPIVPFVKPHVRRVHQAYLEDLKNTEMPMVYEAVNKVQRTGWRINERTLVVLQTAHRDKLIIAGLPAQDDLSLPEKPADIETNEAARKRYSKLARPIYDANKRRVSRHFQWLKTLAIAESAAREGTIYFPHQIDFRGRMYPTTMFLHPQANDYAKALLTFAEADPIETQVQADWLMIHGANTYGYDKVSMRERVAWVQEHEAEIVASAGDPLANRFWADGDKPWQFLAFCFEWAAFLKHGWGYPSSLPVMMDGTCNGLQHFSAMLRDEVGGRATNLVPLDQPQDIYQEVANVAIAKLRAMKADESLPFEQRVQAEQWLAFGVSRKTTKRSVMVVPYGGTLHACREYVMQHITERVEAGEPSPFENNLRAATFMSRFVWLAIGEVVIKSREAMKWLQSVARVMSKAQVPITWTTPVGFPVVQRYPNWERHRIETVFFGKKMKLMVRDEGIEIEKNKQVTAISPNFVHSMDAAALSLYVLRAPFKSFTVVHDAYGTTAAHVDEMNSALRKSFAQMYREHDVLTEFRAECIKALGTADGIAPVPGSGTLDIDGIVESNYFFA